jgi:hypothetical protein
MAQAQLSFHGHRDAVKFFVAVPGMKCGIKTTEFSTNLNVKPAYSVIVTLSRL